MCREIRTRHPEIACLMLTSFRDDEALFSAIMAGAVGSSSNRSGAPTWSRGCAGRPRGALLDPKVTARVLNRLRRRPEEGEPAGLTDQERRILGLIAEGLTNRQISARMYLAEKTVKNYVSNVVAKLGMSRRAEAAAYAARLSERHHHEGHHPQ